MAETIVAVGPVAVPGGDRHLVVMHVDAGVLAGEPGGRCQVESGPAVEPEAVRRVACDAAVAAVVRAGRRAGERVGQVLDVGRTTRRIGRRLRRALMERDGGCRYPGCTESVYLYAHHLVHWIDGGPTSLANLILLCQFHHTAVHDGLLIPRVEHGGPVAAGQVVFRRPDGEIVPEVPRLPELLDDEPGGPGAGAGNAGAGDTGSGTDPSLAGLDPDLLAGTWAGEPFSLADTIASLFSRSPHADLLAPTG
jgi:hypothetical protein